MTSPENPFIFGEIIDEPNFVDRTAELNQLIRDLADGQKVFLLSPRRFGKSSLAALALLKYKCSEHRGVSRATRQPTPAALTFPLARP